MSATVTSNTVGPLKVSCTKISENDMLIAKAAIHKIRVHTFREGPANQSALSVSQDGSLTKGKDSQEQDRLANRTITDYHQLASYLMPIASLNQSRSWSLIHHCAPWTHLSAGGRMERSRHGRCEDCITCGSGENLLYVLVRSCRALHIHERPNLHPYFDSLSQD